MWVCVPECRCPQRSKDRIMFPGTGVAGCHESPDVDAGNQTNSGLLEKRKTLQMLTNSPAPDPIFVTNYLQGSKLLWFFTCLASRSLTSYHSSNFAVLLDLKIVSLFVRFIK